MQPPDECSYEAAFFTLALAVASSMVAVDAFPLKDISSSVDILMTAKQPDPSELGYVAARGTALYLTTALMFEGDADK